MPIGTAAGQPPYDPAGLQKLYGCLNQVRSSRRLAREAVRNVEVMWLKGLWPGYRVPGLDPGIGDFRKERRRTGTSCWCCIELLGGDRRGVLPWRCEHGGHRDGKRLAEQVAVLEQDIAPMRRWRRTTRRRRTRSTA